MLLVGIDFETSGLSSETDRVIEVGAILWDPMTKQPLRILSEFINHPGLVIPEEITEITGITQEMVDKYGIPEVDALRKIYEFSALGEYFVAHNGNAFDKKFYDAMCERHDEVDPMHWIDTTTDIKFPERITTRNLRHLASEHSFLNPFAHRAVFDVLTMLHVLSEYDLGLVLARSIEPMVYVQANVSFDNNQLAKDFSFRWHPGRKIWWKGQKKSDWEAEQGKYQFKQTALAGAPE